MVSVRSSLALYSIKKEGSSILASVSEVPHMAAECAILVTSTWHVCVPIYNEVSDSPLPELDTRKFYKYRCGARLVPFGYNLSV